MPIIPCPLALGASQYPQHYFIKTPHYCWSYGNFNQWVNGIQKKLIQDGLKPHHRVGIQLGSSPEMIATLFACWRLGCLPVLVHSSFSETMVQTYVTRFKLHRVIDQARWVYQCDEPSKVQEVPYYPLRQWGLALFTSGSTGPAKVVVLTIGNVYWNAMGSLAHFVFTPVDCGLLQLPLSHVGGLGMVFRALWSGSSVAFWPKAISLPDQLTQSGCTHVSWVPTQLWRIIKSEQLHHLQALRYIILGGAPVSKHLLDQAKGVPIHQTYGLTEMGSQVTVNGGILPYRQLRLSLNNEIEVKGKPLFLGYLNFIQDSMIAEIKTDVDGWFSTKDVGQMTQNGLEVLGRTDTQFISGGENIHPEWIEQIILEDPLILQAVVVPIPDPEFGMRPVAIVQTRTQFDESRLKSQLKEKLPRYACPIRILEWPKLGFTSLKPNRKDCQKYVERWLIES